MVQAQSNILHWKIFGEEDGLSSKYTYSFCQDKDGFIWIGTGDGLYRYDGHHFVLFDSPLNQDDQTISSLLVSVLYDDFNNRIWLASLYDMQYFDLNDYTFKPWIDRKIKEFTTVNEFKSQIKVSPEKLWFASGEHIFTYHVVTEKFENITHKFKFPSDCRKTYFKFFPYDDDHLIIITPNYAFVADKETYNISHIIKSKHKEYFLKASFDTHYDKIYLAGYESIILYDIVTKKRTEQSLYFSTEKGERLPYTIQFLEPYEEDKFITNIGNHTLFFDKKSEKLQLQIPNNKMIKSIEPNNLFTDSSGNLWASSYQNYCGVIYADTRDIISTPYIINHKAIYVEPFKTIKYNDSLYFFCGSGITGFGLVNPFSGNYEIIENTANISPYVFDIVMLNDGRIWSSTINGIVQIDIKTRQFKNISFYLENETTSLGKIKGLKLITQNTLLAYDALNLYFINTKNLDVVKYNIIKDFPDYETYTDLEFSFLNNVNNLVYLASNIGVLAVDQNQKVTKIDLPTAINTHKKCSKVHAMEVDQDGNFWLGSSLNGLFHYNTKSQTMYHYHKDNSRLRNNFLQFLKLDHYGYLWINAGDRIYTLNTKTIEFVEQFHSDYPLKGGGYGIFGGNKTGILSYNYYPYILFKNLQTKKTIFTAPTSLFLTEVAVNEVKILTKPISKDTTFNLDYQQNNICLSFTNLSFKSSNQGYYYRWSKQDTVWTTSKNNEICFQRLPSGHHILEVKPVASNSKILKITLIIHPIFYKSWWFALILIMSVLSLIYFYYRLKTNRIKSEAKLTSAYQKKIAEIEMKALRAQMNPHFIFNSLNSIQKFIFEKDEYAASQYLTKFSRLIRSILEHSNQEFISIASEMEMLKYYIEMERLRFSNKFEFTLTKSNDVNDSDLIPSMVIQPHVENAIWHGLMHKDESCQLTVVFSRHDDQTIQIVIEDNGVGRSKAEEMKSKQTLKKKSFGSQISKDRIKYFSDLTGRLAKIDIIDKFTPDGRSEGTKVMLILPTKKEV
jgi:sensor histidine kinase YesM